jgi:hypothetical protein
LQVSRPIDRVQPERLTERLLQIAVDASERNERLQALQQ